MKRLRDLVLTVTGVTAGIAAAIMAVYNRMDYGDPSRTGLPLHYNTNGTHNRGSSDYTSNSSNSIADGYDALNWQTNGGDNVAAGEALRHWRTNGTGNIDQKAKTKKSDAPPISSMGV